MKHNLKHDHDGDIDVNVNFSITDHEIIRVIDAAKDAAVTVILVATAGSILKSLVKNRKDLL